MSANSERRKGCCDGSWHSSSFCLSIILVLKSCHSFICPAYNNPEALVCVLLSPLTAPHSWAHNRPLGQRVRKCRRCDKRSVIRFVPVARAHSFTPLQPDVGQEAGYNVASSKIGAFNHICQTCRCSYASSRQSHHGHSTTRWISAHSYRHALDAFR